MNRRTFLTLVSASFAAPSAFATGFGGSSAPSRIPVPARVFKAVVQDLSGHEQAVSRVTFNGEVYIYGTLGEAEVSIPFERIKEVRILETDERTKRIAYATLIDDDTIKVVVEDDVPCYGEASFGNYRIEVSKIRRIVFKHDETP